MPSISNRGGKALWENFSQPRNGCATRWIASSFCPQGSKRWALGALFEAGCHPYHNELSRGNRGGRPRIYFAGDSFDNDAIQGLLDLLALRRPAATVDDRWAILAIDASGESPELRAAMRVLLPALREASGGDRDLASRSVITIASSEGRVARIAAVFGCATIFDATGDTQSHRSTFAAAGMFPAAVMGMDIVALLKGAATMNERFRTAPPGDNPVLDYAAVAHVAAARTDAAPRRIVPWSRALDATAQWCEQLHAECDFKLRRSAPAAGVHTNLIAESVRRDRIVVPPMPGETEGEPLALGGISLPEHQAAAVRSVHSLLAAQRRPSADLILPALEESSLGQLFQMMLLATAIEERLHRGAPDGQPPADR